MDVTVSCPSTRRRLCLRCPADTEITSNAWSLSHLKDTAEECLKGTAGEGLRAKLTPLKLSKNLAHVLEKARHKQLQMS
eukprot:4248601-Amphidinium_carterae.1